MRRRRPTARIRRIHRRLPAEERPAFHLDLDLTMDEVLLDLDPHWRGVTRHLDGP